MRLYVHLCLSRLTCRLICKALTYLAPLRERTHRLHEVTKPVFRPPSRGERGCEGAGGSYAEAEKPEERLHIHEGEGKKGRAIMKEPVGAAEALYLTNIRLTKHALLRIKIADT